MSRAEGPPRGLSSSHDGRTLQERDPLLRERKPDRWRPPAEHASGPQLWIRAAQYIKQPSIRVDGLDIDPGFVDPGDYTPRCRLYRTSEGLRGLPEPAWIEAAPRSAIDRRVSAPS